MSCPDNVQTPEAGGRELDAARIRALEQSEMRCQA
jgi:hypothetical protein